MPAALPTFTEECTSILFTMNTSFITSFSEQEFRDFLKAAIREVLTEEIKQIQPVPANAPLGIKEVAALLGQEISTIYEKTSKKLIPHFKKGNKLYFDRAELWEWIKRGKVKTQTQIVGEAAAYLLRGNKNSRKQKP